MVRQNPTESVLTSRIGVPVRWAQLGWAKKGRVSGGTGGRELGGRVGGALGISGERLPRPLELSNGHPVGLASIKDRRGLP